MELKENFNIFFSRSKKKNHSFFCVLLGEMEKKTKIIKIEDDDDGVK